MCIPPRARANVLGIVNAMASAIVVYFMVISFVVYVGDNRTRTTKFFFSAIDAAKLFHIFQSENTPAISLPAAVAALGRLEVIATQSG